MKRRESRLALAIEELKDRGKAHAPGSDAEIGDGNGLVQVGLAQLGSTNNLWHVSDPNIRPYAGLGMVDLPEGRIGMRWRRRRLRIPRHRRQYN